MISMKIEAIIIYIVIPIVAAAIGGTITLFGVKATIKNQEKREKESRINSIRPWIYFSDSISGMVDASISLFPENYDEKTELNSESQQVTGYVSDWHHKAGEVDFPHPHPTTSALITTSHN